MSGKERILFWVFFFFVLGIIVLIKSFVNNIEEFSVQK